MIFKVRLFGEASGANKTFERPWTTVDIHVRLQITRCWERFRTQLTFMRFFLKMKNVQVINMILNLKLNFLLLFSFIFHIIGNKMMFYISEILSFSRLSFIKFNNKITFLMVSTFIFQIHNKNHLGKFFLKIPTISLLTT